MIYFESIVSVFPLTSAGHKLIEFYTKRGPAFMLSVHTRALQSLSQVLKPKVVPGPAILTPVQRKALSYEKQLFQV